MLLNVWQQCAIEDASKVQRQIPGPAYFADYIMSKYGIEVPDQVRQLSKVASNLRLEAMQIVLTRLGCQETPACLLH
jgi:hypothetical protein